MLLKDSSPIEDISNRQWPTLFSVMTTLNPLP